MPEQRGTHGCIRVKMHDTDYIAILGGGTATAHYLTIQYFNIAQKLWEVSVSTRQLPSFMTVFLVRSTTLIGCKKNTQTTQNFKN